MVEILEKFDAWAIQWLYNIGLVPSAVIIAVTIVIGIYVVFDLRWFVSNLLLRKVDDKFRAEFNDPIVSDARAIVRRRTAAIFRAWSDAEKPERLRDLLSQVPPPDGLPLANEETLVEWAERNTPHWTDQREVLWRFISQIYDPQRREGEIDFDYDRSRRIVAKFWDRWGAITGFSRIARWQLRRHMQSNVFDLNLCVYLEIAQVMQMDWDRSSGKSGLFRIAHRAWDIEQEDRRGPR